MKLVRIAGTALEQLCEIELAHGLSVPRHTRRVSSPDAWREVDGALERTFRFPDFVTAMIFINRVAELAEAANHHPDIAVHYDRVTLRWWTHAAGGITERDRELAEQTTGLAPEG